MTTLYLLTKYISVDNALLSKHDYFVCICTCVVVPPPTTDIQSCVWLPDDAIKRISLVFTYLLAYNHIVHDTDGLVIW